MRLLHVIQDGIDRRLSEKQLIPARGRKQYVRCRVVQHLRLR